jgi:L-amino acid N-acyltransferase YncA
MNFTISVGSPSASNNSLHFDKSRPLQIHKEKIETTTAKWKAGASGASDLHAWVKKSRCKSIDQHAKEEEGIAPMVNSRFRKEHGFGAHYACHS